MNVIVIGVSARMAGGACVNVPASVVWGSGVVLAGRLLMCLRLWFGVHAGVLLAGRCCRRGQESHSLLGRRRLVSRALAPFLTLPFPLLAKEDGAGQSCFNALLLNSDFPSSAAGQ